MNRDRKGSNSAIYAVDIGSTIIKIAEIMSDGTLIKQQLFPRDFNASIAQQTLGLLADFGVEHDNQRIKLCSSANGGLRVGIVCLTQNYSGMVIRNQVLLAGANPIYLYDLDADHSDRAQVDILVLGGGVDCPDSLMASKLETFDAANFDFKTLVYCGNKYLHDYVQKRFPGSVIIENPLSDSLDGRLDSVFHVLRRAYLADLVYKEGITELGHALRTAVHPTPEIVSRGFQTMIKGQSTMESSGASLLIDVGGATTDLHYTTEIIRDDSESHPLVGKSTSRYVFTDLGVVASRATTLLQIQCHPQLSELLRSTLLEDAAEIYQSLREGTYEPSPQVLGYACLFLALDRFITGKGPGLPSANLAKLSEIILTGGATQDLDLRIVENILELLLPKDSACITVRKDDHYQIWAEGLVNLEDEVGTEVQS